MDAAARSSSDRLITVIAPDTARPAGVGHRVPDRQGAIGPCRCLPGRVRNLDAARTAAGRSIDMAGPAHHATFVE